LAPNLERGLFFNNETTDKCGHLARERRAGSSDAASQAKRECSQKEAR